MRTLDRYISNLFLKFLFMSSMALAFLFIFQELLRELIDQDYPAAQAIKYHLLNMPQVYVNFFPPAVLTATVFTLSTLAKSNELVACFSIGVSMKRIISLLLSLVFTASCLTLVIQDRLLPPLFRTRTIFHNRVMKGREDFFLDVKKDKIWYRSKNLIYNIKTFDKDLNKIYGMSVYVFDKDFLLTQIIEAKQAFFEPKKNGEQSVWRLEDGTVANMNTKDGFPKSEHFDARLLTIQEEPKDFQGIEKEVDGLRVKELYHYIKKVGETGADTKIYEVKLQSKIATAFMPLVMCLLGVPFAGRSRREGGASRDVGLSLVMTFFYWISFSITLSLGTKGVLPPWLAAWAPTMVFSAVSVALMIKREVWK